MTKLQDKYGEEYQKNIAEAEEGNQRLFTAQAKIAKQIPGIGGALGKAFDMKTKVLSFSTDIGKLGKTIGGDFGKAMQ